MSRTIPPSSSASAIRGLWFVFQDAGASIAIWVSSLSGKEELYVNGALMATRRKIALSSTHEVEVNGSKYTVCLSTKNLRRGVFQCVLSRNGAPVEGWETEYIARRRWQQIAGTVVGAALLTYSGLKWGWAPIVVVAGVAASAGLSYALFSRGSGYVVRPLAMRAGAA